MKKLKSETMQRLFLAIEAGLVLIGVLLGKTGIVSFACYWGLVTFYHLTDFLFTSAKDAAEKGDTDGRQSD